MKKIVVAITLMSIQVGLFAQIDASLLVGMTHATNTEMLGIASPISGSMLFNTTDNSLYQYNGTVWEILGQTGPTGPAGPQGPQGIAGDPASDDQTLTSDGTAGNISISGGNILAINVDDADADSTNEIQTLSLSGNELTISGAGGNTVSLTPLVDTNLATDNLVQSPETRTYDMNSEALGFTNGNVGIGNSTPNSMLQLSGSFSSPIRTTSVNTTLGPNDFTLITTITKDLIITLPAANLCVGRIYVIKNIGDGDNITSTNYIKANGDLDNKIDKDSTMWIQSDGTNWQLINQI